LKVAGSLFNVTMDIGFLTQSSYNVDTNTIFSYPKRKDDWRRKQDYTIKQKKIQIYGVNNKKNKQHAKRME
jgi:hypothetical protein